MDAMFNSGTANLAYRLSKCRVDAMAFDGIEPLFYPVYDASPGVKVVILSWRTYEEWQKSLDVFSVKFFLQLAVQACLNNSPHFLPWGAIVMPVLDMLGGGGIDKFLRNGDSLTFTKGLAVRFFHNQVFARRYVSHALSGLEKMMYLDRESYYAFFEEIRKRVPEKDRMEWNVRKNNLQDLCDFLGIKGHPGCREKMPRVTVEILRFERNEPLVFTTLVAIYIALHVLNYKILYGTIGFLVSTANMNDGKSKTE